MQGDVAVGVIEKESMIREDTGKGIEDGKVVGMIPLYGREELI